MSTAESRETVLEIARMLDEHQGSDTVVLFLGQTSSITDYFVISTVRNAVHMRGLLNRIHEYFRQQNIVPLNHRRRFSGQEWVLVDCGDFVVHLMDGDRRAFYELERLHFDAQLVYQSSKSP